MEILYVNKSPVNVSDGNTKCCCCGCGCEALEEVDWWDSDTVERTMLVAAAELPVVGEEDDEDSDVS